MNTIQYYGYRRKVDLSMLSQEDSNPKYTFFLIALNVTINTDVAIKDNTGKRQYYLICWVTKHSV